MLTDKIDRDYTAVSKGLYMYGDKYLMKNWKYADVSPVLVYVES